MKECNKKSAIGPYILIVLYKEGVVEGKLSTCELPDLYYAWWRSLYQILKSKPAVLGGIHGYESRTL